jgi:flagellin-specific chaperone FliS
VLAFYADLKTSSTFTISNASQADPASKLELRTLKKVMLQALDVVNNRVKGLIEAGYVLPEDVAGKYSEGVSEASLVLEAIEFGDAAEAKKHMISSIRDLRGVLNALSEENLARFEQTAEHKAASDENADVVGTYNWLQKYYQRLEELAEKNEVDEGNQLNIAALFLRNAKQMIDEGDFEDAEKSLERVNIILEEIRANLIASEEEEQTAAYTNDTSQEDSELARKLIEFAAKYESKALELLNKTSSSDAQIKIQEALSLIANARISIEAHELESARTDLQAAYMIITEVEEDFEEPEEHEDTSDDDSDNDNSAESSKEEDSDNGKDKDEDDDHSGSGRSDEDDSEKEDDEHEDEQDNEERDEDDEEHEGEDETEKEDEQDDDKHKDDDNDDDNSGKGSNNKGKDDDKDN